jgi:N-acetylglutamate synthase-like GNAT family acetyltransferase
MHIEYRNATSQDATRLSQLLAELGYTVDADEVVFRLESIRTRGGEVIVATDKVNIWGCITLLLDVRLAEGASGEIATLVVDSRQRGRGIGNGLIAQARNWFLKNDCQRVRIRANTIRNDAHRFYLNLGFKEMKTQKVFLMDT